LKEEEQAELLLDSFFPQKKFNKRHAQTTTTQFRIYTQNSQERRRRRRSRGLCCLLFVPTESRHQRSKERSKQGDIQKGRRRNKEWGGEERK
jgi:hypothetical protein